MSSMGTVVLYVKVIKDWNWKRFGKGLPVRDINFFPWNTPTMLESSMSFVIKDTNGQPH
jgi:hypothetical protein